MPFLAEAGWLPQMRDSRSMTREKMFDQKAETRSALAGRAVPAGIGM